MLSALWAPAEGKLALMIHHLAVDGVSWRILLEDLNVAWAQRRSGLDVALAGAGTSFVRWASLLREQARSAGVVESADVWRSVSAVPPALPVVRPSVDTYAVAGTLSVALDADVTRMLLGEVPAAFHAGVQDVLLIAFALAWNEFLGAGGAPIGIDLEGHGRAEELAADIDLSRTVGWFTAKYPAALSVGDLTWAQVSGGDSALGIVVKSVKEQLRGLPDPLSYGLLRYLNRKWPCHIRTPPSDSTISDGWALGRRRLQKISGRSATRGCPGRARPRRSRCPWPTRWSSTPASWSQAWSQARGYRRSGHGRRRWWTRSKFSG